jgi:hypothetical protein
MSAEVALVTLVRLAGTTKDEDAKDDRQSDSENNEIRNFGAIEKTHGADPPDVTKFRFGTPASPANAIGFYHQVQPY